MLELVNSLQHLGRQCRELSMNLFKISGISEYFWLIEAYFRLWHARAMLKFSGMPWLQNQVRFDSKALQKVGDENHSSEKNSPEPLKSTELTKRIAIKECVRLASRLHAKSVQCLPRSIVLRTMLTKIGDEARVVVGINTDQGGFASHAWVEIKIAGQWQALGEPESLGKDFVPI